MIIPLQYYHSLSGLLDKYVVYWLACKKGQEGFDFGLSEYFSLSHFLVITLYVLKICRFSLRVYIRKSEKKTQELPWMKLSLTCTFAPFKNNYNFIIAQTCLRSRSREPGHILRSRESESEEKNLRSRSRESESEKIFLRSRE